MKKFLLAISAFLCASSLVFSQAVPLSQSLNNIPTASSLNNNEQFVLIQGGIGKKASSTLMTGYIATLLDGDLQAFAALSGTNTIYYRSGTNTWAPVTIGSNLTFSGGTLSATGGGGGGTWGSITGTLSNQTDLQAALNAKQTSDGDLDALAALAGVNTMYYRSAASVWSPVGIGANLTFSGGTLSATGGGGGSGTVTATSGSLGANQIILGNVGVDIKQLGSLGTNTTVLHGNAAGAPFFGAVSLSSDITGILLRPAGGLGADTSTYGTGLLGSDGSSNTIDVDTIGELYTALSLTGTLSGSTFLSGDGSFKTVTASAPGANSHVLFNDGGTIGSDADFIWDKNANTLTIPIMAVSQLNTNGFKVMDAVNQSNGVSFQVSTDLVADKTFTYTGAFDFTMTVTANTSVTFPTSGTLATLTDLAGAAATTADYLVGTANGALSAEIVVGTSPGGELGGTWSSPTIDDSVAVTSWNLTTPTITGAAIWQDGIRQTFNPDGTNSGLNVGSQAGDPSSPSNGDIWYDSTANTLDARINGATVNLGAGGGGGAGTKTIAVFKTENNNPPAANFATLDTRNSISVLDFDDTTEESAIFVGIVPEAAVLTSGLIVRIHFAATSATTGNARWGVQIERANTDLDADSFDAATEATTATSGTSGIIVVTAITTTTIDSLAAGESYRLKVYRDVSDAADTVTGDLEVTAIEVRTAN